jgi:hypothetical protein
MSNMAYCRFQNTVLDLQDCFDSMNESDLSEEETRAKERLIKLCVDIACDFGNCEELLKLLLAYLFCLLVCLLLLASHC